MRTPVDWMSASLRNYKDFRKKHPSINISKDEWLNILYTFNYSFRDYILETGEKAKLPYGFGDLSIIKKKRKQRIVNNGIEYINLPVDWKKTLEKKKKIYNFNYHTEGYFFGWWWFKKTSRIKFAECWYFRPNRTTKRILAHYLKIDENYQHLYQTWRN